MFSTDGKAEHARRRARIMSVALIQACYIVPNSQWNSCSGESGCGIVRGRTSIEFGNSAILIGNNTRTKM